MDTQGHRISVAFSSSLESCQTALAADFKVAELPDYDPSEYLHEEDIAAYLTAILDENDPALLARLWAMLPALVA